MSSLPRTRLLARTRDSMARARARRRLGEVIDGTSRHLAMDLGDPAVDSAALIGRATAAFGPGSVEIERTVEAMRASSLYDTVLDQLAAQQPGRCARSARLAGALRIEPAVPALVELLSAEEPLVRDAAARALGRIGGARGAAGLLDAVRQGAAGPTAVIELAHAAPDLSLEAALSDQAAAGTAAPIAAAAGLRGRSAAIRPLLALLQRDAASERAAGCRALGWMGAQSAAPAVAARLRDPSWEVRMSAVKALRRLRAWRHGRDIARLLADPNMRVRRAAHNALRGLAVCV